MTEENIKTFKDMDEIHEKARVVITKEFNEMLEKAYMCGFEDGKKSIEKIRAEINRQEKWLLQVGYTAYNVDIAFDAIKAVLAESEVEE